MHHASASYALKVLLSLHHERQCINHAGAPQSFFSANVQDEYDPARPNDYEEIRRARERQRVEAEREAERQEELREQKAAQEVGITSA